MSVPPIPLTLSAMDDASFFPSICGFAIPASAPTALSIPPVQLLLGAQVFGSPSISIPSPGLPPLPISTELSLVSTLANLSVQAH